MERLYRTISNFDRSWSSKCMSASDRQIQQLENICAEYGYRIPKVYLDYLKAMGENDGGLLEREWDGYMEPNIHTILELFCDEDFEAKEYLQRGFFCFLTSAVTDWKDHYFAGSFEKYLFQKAFNMYQEKFEHKVSVGTSVNSCDAILKKYSFPCSICGGTAEEKMEFVRWLAVRFLDLHEEEVWFGDKLHYFSYNEHYALSVNTYHSPLLVFSCDDILLKKKIDAQLNSIFS